MDVRMYQKELQEVGEGHGTWVAGPGPPGGLTRAESSPKGPLVIIGGLSVGPSLILWCALKASLSLVVCMYCVDIMVRVENRVPFA